MRSAVAIDVGGVTRPGRMSSVAVAGVIGTIVEWYDFLIYGTAAALVIYHLMRNLSRWRGTTQEPASPASAPGGDEPAVHETVEDAR